MQRIYLVRHGETNWNRQLRYQGQRDIPLNEEGLRQATCIAGYLEDEQIETVYSSPLLRAQKTAALIAEKHGLKPSLEHGLMEIDFGDWEGRRYNELNEEEQDFAKRWFFNPDTITIPGGESYSVFKKRVLEGYGRIRQMNKNIAVVTHAGVIRVIVATLLDMPAANITRLKLSPASLTVLLYDDWENPYLEVYNDSCYLLHSKNKTVE
jgi:phosphoserine phosphatase